MTFQKLIDGQWQTIPATIYKSNWLGRDRFTVSYKCDRVPCITWVDDSSITERVLEDAA